MYLLKTAKILIFRLNILNVVSSFNIENRVLKLSVFTIYMVIEGTEFLFRP